MSRLDRAGAHQRAQRVRDGVLAIDTVIETLIEIQERQDWLALGYKSWSEYCDGEFGPARLKLTQEQRGRVVAVLVASGMSKRRVSVALGVSEGTVRGDLRQSLVRKNTHPEIAEPQVNTDTAAAASSRPADGGDPRPTSPPPATGPGASEPTGEADRPGPVVTPQDVAPPPAPDAGVPGAGGPAEPEELPSPLSGEADPVQDGDRGVTRPAPDPSDPAALLVYCADLWGYVDFEAAGPMLTSDDMRLINQSLLAIANGVEALVHWRDRAQP